MIINFKNEGYFTYLVFNDRIGMHKNKFPPWITHKA